MSQKSKTEEKLENPQVHGNFITHTHTHKINGLALTDVAQLVGRHPAT